ncbi:MAG: hypothetical protein WDM78_10760 [Puia sp.]
MMPMNSGLQNLLLWIRGWFVRKLVCFRGPYCDHLITGYFIPGVSSAKTCTHLQEVILSADEKISYCRSCMPVNGYKKKLFRIIPPEMQRYYAGKRHCLPKNTSPQSCLRKNIPGRRSVITSLSSGFEYLISKKDPEPLQLSCHSGNDVSRIYWYINNRFYKAVTAGSKQFFYTGRRSGENFLYRR